MPHLSLHLLGSFQAILDEQQVTGFESNKVRALLAYLAAEAERPHSRDELIGLLWPNQTDRTARSNLSQALSNLRRAVGDQTVQPPFLKITRESIQFNSNSDHYLDSVEFTELLLSCKQHEHRHPRICKSCAQRQQRVIEIYRGSFLDHFFLADSPTFEEWMLLKRERLREQALDAAYHLADFYIQRSAYELAEHYAERQLEFDPWREEAHRQAMHAMALNGRRSEALAQYEKCRRILADELNAQPAHETIALYEQIRSNKLKIERSTLKMRSSNVPAPTTSFIGRETELARLTEMLENPACRLITLVGPGGIGKTRLALQAAAEHAESFVHGVFFVPLTETRSGELLISAITLALRLSLYGPTDPKAQVLNYLREKDLLLVLDSFEHILSESDVLLEILQHAPRAVLLVTSRERLGVPGEWALNVYGLQFPDSGSTERLETYSAIMLFIQHGRMVHPSFALSQDDEIHVAHLCRLVEGMPLAIELATTWLPVLSCNEIVREIESNLGFLDVQHLAIAERHRSMRAVFERSWDLLTETEKSVFRRLSVFRGGFSKEAADYITGGTLSTLASLVDKSLVRRNQTGRYGMHELVWQYAKEKLQEFPNDEETTYERHRRFFLDFLQQRLLDLKGPRQLQAVAEIETEIENVRNGLRRTAMQDGLVEISKLLTDLWVFFDTRGQFHEAEALFTWLMQLAVNMKEFDQTDKERAIATWTIQAHRGWFLLRIGRYDQSTHLLQESVEMLRQLGSLNDSPEALLFLGIQNWLVGDYAQARRVLLDGLALAKQRHDQWDEALYFGNLGLIAQSLGEYAEAKQHMLRGLTLFRQLEDTRAMASALGFVSLPLCALGELAEARRLLEEGLALSKAANDPWLTVISLNHLGLVAYLNADYAEAYQYHHESLAKFKDLGDRSQGAQALCYLGHVSVAMGEHQAAKQFFYEALQMAKEAQGIPVELNALLGLIAVLMHRDETQHQWIFEILSLIASHAASSKDTREHAERLLAQLKSALTPEAISLLHERGVTRTLEQVVDELLLNTSFNIIHFTS